MESDTSQAFSKSQSESLVRVVASDPHGLHAHPSYTRHGLSVPACKVSALRGLGELAFIEPLTITRDRTIIDGYARWELAKELKRPILNCLEYDLSQAESLEWLLHKHRRSDGLNDYSRIMLALDLEPELADRARANKQIGGQQKGWSNLTKVEQVHVRSEIAKVAAVSAGNVTKVKQLNDGCLLELRDGLYSDEISIHWAWKLRNDNPEDQLDALARFRFEKGLKREIRQLATRRRFQVPTQQNAHRLMSRLSDLSNEKLEAVRVTILKGLKPEIFITEALAQMVGLEQLTLWNQNAICKSLPLITESCGIKKESEMRSATI